MKKTLVAIAALAIVGAASAQSTVTLTGAYAFGYESSHTAAGVSAGGLGTDTAGMRLTATEDLGGGLSASAYISAGGLVRGSAVGGEDAALSFTGGFGKITLTSFESGHGLIPRAGAGAPGYGLDGKVFSANANIDLVGWSSASMGGATFGVTYADRGTAATSNGLAAGTSGASANQPSIGVSVSYANGPVDARVDYTSWTRRGDVTVAGSVLQSRVRLSGNYNLGVAKVGLGYSTLSRTTGVTTNETMAGLSAPVGAVTLGGTWGRSVSTGSALTRSGYTLGASYDLSKRTNIGASYFNWSTATVAGNNTGARVLIGHSF